SAERFCRTSNGAFCLNQPGQSKIGQVWFTFGIEQNISRLNVAMQNPVLMRVVDGACQFRNQLRGSTDLYRLAFCHSVQRFAVAKAHAEITATIPFADLVNGYDGRMIEPGRSFSFQSKQL